LKNLQKSDETTKGMWKPVKNVSESAIAGFNHAKILVREKYFTVLLPSELSKSWEKEIKFHET